MFRLRCVWNYTVRTTKRCKQVSLWIIPKRSASLLRKSGYGDFCSFMLEPLHLEPESVSTYIYFSFRLIHGITHTPLFSNSLSGGSTRHGGHWLAYCSLHRVIMMENLVEWKLAGETEVPGENPPQRHFVHHKSNLTYPGSNPGRRGGKPATNRLSCGPVCADSYCDALSSSSIQISTVVYDCFSWISDWREAYWSRIFWGQTFIVIML
jgi:hypothetical protein